MTDSSNYYFRRGTSSDADQVSHVVGSTWSQHFSWSVPESDHEIYRSQKVSSSQMKKEIESPHQRFIVAYTSTSTSTSAASNAETEETHPSSEHRDIVGVAQITLGPIPSCVTSPSPIELQRFYILTNHHGKGLAQGLMRQVEELIKEEGGKSIWLGVWENNPRGYAFYTKCGFKEVGEHLFVLGSSHRRDQIMQRPLET